MTPEETLELADQLCRSIERGDLDVVRSLYATDAVIWANFDDRDGNVDRSLRILEWMCSKLTHRQYEVRRRELIPGGFLQEHILRGTAPDGSDIAMPACIIATVSNGVITRLHEYLDPAGVAALNT